MAVIADIERSGTFSGMAWKNRGKYRQKYACKEKTGPVFGPGKGK